MVSLLAFAYPDKDFPPKPSTPRLVNDLAGMMTPAQQDELERMLVRFDQESSTQISIVTIKNLGDYEVAQYATELGNKWGIGQKGKDNGVLIFASAEDRKINIAPGYGLEGALTDAMCGRIIRNEMVPEFKSGHYFNGFSKAADAVVKATKGEYTADPKKDGTEGPGVFGIVLVMAIIIFVIIAASKGGGSGGGRGGKGTYMSRRGGDILTGALLGSLLGGGRGGGGGWGSGGGGGFGGGGFGGFGGGSFGGGGASGSW